MKSLVLLDVSKECPYNKMQHPHLLVVFDKAKCLDDFSLLKIPWQNKL